MPRKPASKDDKEKEALRNMLERGTKTWLKNHKKRAAATGNWEFSEKIIPVPVDKLEPHPFQVRRDLIEDEIKELAESMNLNGLGTPLLVLSRPDDSTRFYILDGTRRWRAAKMLKWPEVRCYVSQGLRDEQALTLMLTMDGNREKFNPIERGKAFRVLREELELTQRGLEHLLRISQSEINRCEVMVVALHPEIVNESLGPNGRWLTHNHLRQFMRLRDLRGRQLELFRQGRETKYGIRLLKQKVDEILQSVPKPRRDHVEVEDATFSAKIVQKTIGVTTLPRIEAYLGKLNLEFAKNWGLSYEDLAEWYNRMAGVARREHQKELAEKRHRLASRTYDGDGS